MNVEFLLPAYYEYSDAVDYYNLRFPGLGSKLESDFRKAIERIKKYPDAWQQETKETRRVLLSSFPYKIVYHLYDETVYIIAFAHTHQKPYYWVDRM